MPPDGTNYKILCGQNEASEEKATPPVPGGSDQPLAPGTTNYSKVCGDGTGAEDLGAGSGLAVRDEGAQITANAYFMDFIGVPVTASVVPGGGVQVDLTSVGGNPVEILDEGNSLVAQVASINFVGPRITASVIGSDVTVTDSAPTVLDQLDDVDVSSPQAAEVLRHDGASFKNTHLAMADLADVTDTPPSADDILQFNETSGQWEVVPNTGGALPDLDGLTDVDVSGAVAGQFMKKIADGTAGDWTNVDLVIDDISDFDPSVDAVVSFNGRQGAVTPEAGDYAAFYADINHNHDADYAPIDHNHDADYAPIGHVHALDDLSDVATAGQQSGYILISDGANWSPGPVPDPGTQSPLTTKGDLWGYSTLDARVPIGSDGQVLTADAGQALGLRWADQSAAGVTPILLVVNGAKDGANKIFTVTRYSDGSDVPLDSPFEVELYMDGVRQQPFIDFNVTEGVNEIIMVLAPLADADMWGVYKDFIVTAVTPTYLEMEDNTPLGSSADARMELEDNSPGAPGFLETELLTPGNTATGVMG